MVKCDICRSNIENTFLGKIMGTMILVDSNKKYVCSECQKKVKDVKAELS